LGCQRASAGGHAEVVVRLTQDIRWTTDLGNAFLAQQADVMSAAHARARPGERQAAVHHRSDSDHFERYHNGLAGRFQGRNPWVHDPGHPLGVAYPNLQLSSRFGAASQASRMAAGRSGNWHGFGEGNVGNLESFRSTAN